MKGRKGPLVVLEYPRGPGGGLNGPRYKEQVLEKVLKGFHAEMSQKRGNVLFMQDGTPAHCPGHIKQWLHDHNIPCLFHLASSPDLNPIEPVWHKIKKVICAQNKLPTNVKDLCIAIFEAWRELPIKDIDKYISSMGNCCSTVLRVKGEHTRY